MANHSDTEHYLDILAAYDPEAAAEIRERHRNGIDVLDELYEMLSVHDELAAEAYLDA